jgi:adenylate cyclase
MKFAGFVRQHVQRISLGLLILFTLLLHTAGLIELGWMHRFETYSYDLRLQATMPGGVDRRIVIVDIDDKSLNEQGQWPWPRNKLALMVDQLFDRYKINVLGFDVLFAEPDHSSGIRTLEELARGELQDDSRYVQALDKLRPQLQYDQLFANSLKNRNVVLGYYFRHDHQAGKSTGQVGQLPPPVLPAGSFAPEAVGADVASGYSANLPVLQQAAVSGGFINASPLVDADGVFRRIPLLQMHGAALYETLSLAVARLALKQPQLRLHYDYGQIDLQWLDAILLGDRRVPIDANVAALAPFRGPQGSFVYVSASDVLSGTANADALAGAIVLVGTTAPGLKDLRSTPVEKVYAGVEMHANMVAGILDSSVKERPAYFLALELLGLVLLGGLLILALPALSPIHAAVLTGATMAFLVGTNLYYWQVQSLVLPLASGLVLVSALFVLNMSWGFFVDSRAKRALARLFGQYVPPELVDEMAQDPSAYSLAGENRQMTVLFSDVRGFTTISEGLTPEQLTQLMNEYLTPMTQVIHRHRGTIDKYMGDAIMAFWGAPVHDPDHARHALQAAMDMTTALVTLQPHFQARGWPPIQIGVGLNTGEMTVGNMGSEFRLAYTVMGDAVNLGSAPGESHQAVWCTNTGQRITAALLPDYAFREIDRVRVKGKDEPVTIFEPLGKLSQLSETDKIELEAHQAALKAYRNQDWSTASSAFDRLHNEYPHRSLYRIFAVRSGDWTNTPPGADWDGAHNLMSK